MTRTFIHSAAIAVLLLGGGSAQLTLADTPAKWDQASAARYLDARMDMWWEKAKTLKTGDGETKCLSCHTAVPYTLARAALRRAEGKREPTANEQKMLEFVTRRVAYLDSDQPYYNHNPAKIIESRGTEAVINALVLTQRDADLAAKTPGDLTVRAMARLWDTQRADGGWDWLNFTYEPSESADSAFQGAAIAAVAIGSETGMKASANEKGRAGLEKLRGYMQANVGAQNLYNKSWALVASARVPNLITPAQRDAIIRDLDAAQAKDGGWALMSLGPWRYSKTEPPFESEGTLNSALLAQSDGFGTGLVVYAMRAAGRGESHPAVEKGRRWLIEHQTPERAGDEAWAPWRAHSLNHDREHGGPKGEIWRRMFMSDMATSFAALALQ